jgi:16S rRNA (guanine(966)-N(2))-methyltransferase RsmD
VSRIIAGHHGGRRLATPAGRDTRPTSDRVREALFNTLESMTELSGARFADLYAGSGAVGLEAFSRGASGVLLVEADPRAARVARYNVEALAAASSVILATVRVEQVLAGRPDRPYDVVFADPPYALPTRDLGAVLTALVDNGWLAAEAVVVVERSSRAEPPPWPVDLEPERSRRYGETTLWYARFPGVVRM